LDTLDLIFLLGDLFMSALSEGVLKKGLNSLIPPCYYRAGIEDMVYLGFLW
jgi:hypothetical protein